jgi:hypothetical protein
MGPFNQTGTNGNERRSKNATRNTKHVSQYNGVVSSIRSAAQSTRLTPLYSITLMMLVPYKQTSFH